MSEQCPSRSFVWRQQMQRARYRWEKSERDRRAYFAYIPLTREQAGGMKQWEFQPIVPEHVERRIQWLKDWLDYGQELGERKFFTAGGWLHDVGLGRRTGKSGSNS